MNIVDMHNPHRVDKTPDSIEILLSSGNFIQDEFTIFKVELRLYNEHIDDSLGVYSLITSFVETDKGTVEMIYDEGFRGNDALETSSKFLTENLGISSLILRSLIFLDGK
jgi:hypothetical protein